MRTETTSVLARYTARPETEETLRELIELLDGAPEAAVLTRKAAWLEAVVGWLRTEGSAPGRRDRLAAVESPGSSRLRLLVELLGQVPRWRESVRNIVGAVLAESSAVQLFTEPGLSMGRGLLGDVALRMGQRLVPSAPEDRDLAGLLWRMLPDERGAAWLDGLAEEHLVALCALLRDDDGRSCFAPLRSALASAAAVLAARCSATATAGDILSKLPPAPAEQLPFLTLPSACEALRTASLGEDADALERARRACADIIGRCHAATQSVLGQMHESAVDTDLVYRLDQLGLALERLEALLWFLAPEPASATPRTATRLLSSLVRAHARDRSVKGLFRSARYVSRRIFEHTGEVGRHYITTSGPEYRRMVKAAAGGGLLTVGTAALKLTITFAALPLFFEGMAAAANYALSFMLIQLLGFALATKQPSMTAAALAATLDVKAGDKGMRGLVDQVARISRSQLASVVGNLGAVLAGATLVGVGMWKLRGEPLLTADQAEYVLTSLHPLHSGTLLFAALTGVLLWCSSVFGGWLENLVKYRRLPEALARHPGLVRLVGEDRAKRLGALLRANACGLGANVSLGLLLGMTPAICRFFGLGMDVRHVTLSAGTLAFAAGSLPPERLLQADVLWAVAGIGGIAVMNLSVSFWLGLSASVRSRGLEPLGILRLSRAVLAGGIRSVSDFVLPPHELLPARPPRSPNGVRSAARATQGRAQSA